MNLDNFPSLDQFYDDDDAEEQIDLSIIKKLDRYKDTELIASGGMKNIYKAFDTKSKRFVALAKLRNDVPEEYCEDFMNEAYLTASLEHPNIISVYDIGVDEYGSPVFTMELKVGDSLADILNKCKEKDAQYLQRFSLQKKLDIFIKVCDAISYAHSQGVLHLDIKPDNIQVGQFGEVQVCDWGLGSHIDKVNTDIEENVLKGTPGFMAPEQIVQKLGKDFSTDIYALGVLLYASTTNCEPGSGGLRTIILKTVAGEILSPKLDDSDVKIPQGIKAVISKAMDVEKKQRYESVEALKKDIEYFLSGRSTDAEEASFLKEFSLFYKRNRPVYTVILIALFIIIFGSSYFLLKLKKSNNQLIAANQQINETLEESERNYGLYKEKVEVERKLVNNILKDDFKDQVLKLQAPLFFISSSNQIDRTIDRLLKNHKTATQLNRTDELYKALFISQQFDNLLKLIGESESDLKPFAEKFARFEKDELGLLRNEGFLLLIKDINKMPLSFRLEYAERMATYFLRKAARSYLHQDIVLELVKGMNPDWQTVNFKYSSKDLNLYISGKELTTLMNRNKTFSGGCILRFLKIDYLYLNGSGIEQFNELDGLNVKGLDLRDTKFKDFKNIRKLKNLTKVIISKGQVPPEELKRALPWVNIEEL